LTMPEPNFSKVGDALLAQLETATQLLDCIEMTRKRLLAETSETGSAQLFATCDAELGARQTVAALTRALKASVSR
jgi:hypothetical protein